MSREMASKTGTRVETDTMGAMTVKADRYWGAQTQRSIENFAIGEPSERMPMQVVKALGLIKKAAANVNLRFGILDKKLGAAIIKAAGLRLCLFENPCTGCLCRRRRRRHRQRFAPLNHHMFAQMR